MDIPDGSALGLHIIRPGNVGDGAVGGDHDTDGAVLGDDLSRTNLSRLRQRVRELTGSADGMLS